MYADLLKQKFPHDERAGLYKAPQLPAVKLGKMLMKDTRISSPNDVIALHINGGTFSSTAVVFTKDECYYDGGSFLLEDVRECQAKGEDCVVFVNQKGGFIEHRFEVKSSQVAEAMRKVFQNIAHKDPVAERMIEKTYPGFEGKELDWLRLRDEVMKTIDLLYDRFNEGKLSLMEYEDKKADLLDRL